MNNDEKKRFKQLADKYDLAPSDFWKSPQGFVIISRRGIEKIQNGLNAVISYSVVPEFSDASDSRYVVKAVGTVRFKKPEVGSRISEEGFEVLTVAPNVRTIETFGESSPKNTRGGAQAYPVAMAEKRALARCILKLSDFYTLNVFSEDEVSE
jgi:hypothetical protein